MWKEEDDGTEEGLDRLFERLEVRSDWNRNTHDEKTCIISHKTYRKALADVARQNKRVALENFMVRFLF
jgi:hypothetical protein